MREIIVDSFAGGGGASTGIELALGRSPDIAINHDAVALAMHEVNHPQTVHLTADIWSVDPREACAGRPVGLLWASPDCKHFSKAKGGKPVDKNIRSLAWIVVHWANVVKPRVIILENVEEFSTWGPLGDDGRPCQLRKGQTFERWTGELTALGYKVEWRELRACDYGAPTIRKRLFLIARRDGKAIVWPEPTHGAPGSEGVASGRLQKWRTAAGIIDWSLPCPSIFDSAEQIMARYGLRAVRPLQPATMARIAKGVKRYVLDAAKPFIIRTDHASAVRAGVHDIEDPARTVTSSGGLAVVQPFVANMTHHGEGQAQDLGDPLATVTAAHRGEKAIVAPFASAAQQGGSVRDAGDPLHTVTASAKDQNQVVAPFLTKFRANSVGSGMEDPAPTVTANSFIQRPGGAAPIGIVAPHLMTMRNAGKPFNEADAPAHTITSGGAHLHLVAAFLAQHNISRGDGINPGRPVDAPVSTILHSGSHQGVVAANLSHQYGSATCGAQGNPDMPLKTVTSGGQHHAVVSSFLQKYYGADQDPRLEDPLHTVTTKDRFGLVTVTIDGEPYVITDIGMRMLTPRELFRAQGFPDSYVIDRRPDGAPISKTDQVAKCGNSVCPPLAMALVAANVPELAERRAAA